MGGGRFFFLMSLVSRIKSVALCWVLFLLLIKDIRLYKLGASVWYGSLLALGGGGSHS